MTTVEDRLTAALQARFGIGPDRAADEGYDETQIHEIVRALSPIVCELLSDQAAGLPPNAHTLTLKFHRLLTEAEWRTLVNATRAVPFARELVANVVWESAEPPV
jgi:hypothetical protein